MSIMPIYLPLVYPDVEFIGSYYSPSGFGTAATPVPFNGAQESSNRRIIVVMYGHRTNSDGSEAPTYSSSNFDNGVDTPISTTSQSTPFHYL